MRPPPPLSVLMPVRDGAAFLGPAMHSVLGQSFSDFEFLIVEDGSTDETPELLAAYAREDRRLRLLATSGAGIVVALNRGLEAARGEWIARMDADDVSLPDRFALQLQAVRERPDLVALGGAAIAMDTRSRETGRIHVPTAPAEVRKELARRNCLLHPTVMFRRDAVTAAGGYRPGCIYAEDYDLWLRLSERGEVANLPDPLIRFRRHPRQTSRTKRRLQRAAEALARQVADRRRRMQPEGVDLDGSLTSAVETFLRQAIIAPIDPAAAKDLQVMLRAVHPGLDRSTVHDVVRLLLRLSPRDAWGLRMRLLHWDMTRKLSGD